MMLASGGFQANTEWRTRYLGPGWELAKVRGTRFNTGDGIRMALDIGARPCGHWSGCHAVGWDCNAPEFGDLAVGDAFQKHSYPFGIMVNANGERFVDEGADFRNYTYAKYGRVILEQPGQFAWQIFDAEGQASAARRIPHQAGHQGARRHARGAGGQAGGRRRAERSSRTIARYNAAVQQRHSVQPERQGRPRHQRPDDRQERTGPTRSTRAAFEAYAVTCGITFTFGGLRINDRGAGDRHRLASRSPASTPRASWSAGSSTSTIRAARA
ncbi:MAG: hypothetical protein QM747_17185 [Nocardioides sp.]